MYKRFVDKNIKCGLSSIHVLIVNPILFQLFLDWKVISFNLGCWIPIRFYHGQWNFFCATRLHKLIGLDKIWSWFLFLGDWLRPIGPNKPIQLKTFWRDVEGYWSCRTLIEFFLLNVLIPNENMDLHSKDNYESFS